MPEKKDDPTKARFVISNWKKKDCPPEECPVMQALIGLKNLSNIRQAPTICTKAGMLDKEGYGNEHYGAGEPKGCLDLAKDIIYTADCNKIITEPEQRKCGSISIEDLAATPPLERVALTVYLIELTWATENQQI